MSAYRISSVAKQAGRKLVGARFRCFACSNPSIRRPELRCLVGERASFVLLIGEKSRIEVVCLDCPTRAFIIRSFHEVSGRRAT